MAGCGVMGCGADGPARRTQREAIEAWGEMTIALRLYRIVNGEGGHGDGRSDAETKD